MEDERQANVAGQKLQKDVADIGSIDIIRASMKIFENHSKELVSPWSQFLLILSSIVYSVNVFVILLYLDQELPLPGKTQYQTFLPASTSAVFEDRAPMSALPLLIAGFGLMSVVLSQWQCSFISLVGRIYSGESVTRVAPFRFLELLHTELWTSSIVYGASAVFLLSIRFVALSFYHRWSWIVSPIAVLSAVASTAGLLAGVLVAQLATVVSEMASCCMEEVSGRAAVTKAVAVLKGKWRVGLGVAGIYGGGMLLMGSNLLRPGFAAGFGTRLLFSSFQILLISIWRQLAFLCWSVLYVSCRAFHHDYIDVYALYPDKERIGSGANDSLL